MSNYRWCLRAVLHAHGIEETSKLQPLLRERGVDLSREQVFRLVTYAPERLSMATLVALCRIFDCTPNEFIDINASAPTALRPRRKPASRPTIALKRVQLR